MARNSVRTSIFSILLFMSAKIVAADATPVVLEAEVVSPAKRPAVDFWGRNVSSGSENCITVRVYLRNRSTGDQIVVRGSSDTIQLRPGDTSHAYVCGARASGRGEFIKMSLADYRGVLLLQNEVTELAPIEIENAKKDGKILVVYAVNAELGKQLSCWSGKLELWIDLSGAE